MRANAEQGPAVSATAGPDGELLLLERLHVGGRQGLAADGPLSARNFMHAAQVTPRMASPSTSIIAAVTFRIICCF